jgi:hypothetical protein
MKTGHFHSFQQDLPRYNHPEKIRVCQQKKRRDGSSSLEGLNGSTSSVTNLSENPRCFKFILALYDPISPKSKRKAGFMISMTTLPQMNQITRLEPTNLANVCKCGFS